MTQEFIAIVNHFNKLINTRVEIFQTWNDACLWVFGQMNLDDCDELIYGHSLDVKLPQNQIAAVEGFIVGTYHVDDWNYWCSIHTRDEDGVSGSQRSAEECEKWFNRNVPVVDLTPTLIEPSTRYIETPHKVVCYLGLKGENKSLIFHSDEEPTIIICHTIDYTNIGEDDTLMMFVDGNLYTSILNDNGKIRYTNGNPIPDLLKELGVDVYV